VGHDDRHASVLDAGDGYICDDISGEQGSERIDVVATRQIEVARLLEGLEAQGRSLVAGRVPNSPSGASNTS